MTATAAAAAVDLLVVGGGINGAAIARDAVGRGLTVLLVEKDDLAGHTSSASTKLIHGGLRYLEQYEFRLVRESLIERERLLRLAPHLIHPLIFVLPHANGTRPAWMIRLGLFLYDHLDGHPGGRTSLPGSRGVSLDGTRWGSGLKPGIDRGFTYADCRVDDSRLVVLNAVDAAARGADIRTRTAFLSARPEGAVWRATLRDARGTREVAARALVNAAGPWVGQVLGEVANVAPEHPPRLVKGSHIIVPRLFEGDHAYILQNPDRRIVFAIPYEGAFTLVGTTDVPWKGDPAAPAIDAAETAYLCESMKRYFARRIGPGDVVSSYSGVRPLYDDGSARASEVTRDYVLRLGTGGRPQLLSVFGGKITTSRRLAEHALEKLAPFLPPMGDPWTGRAPLPGGDLPGGDFRGFLADVRRRWPELPEATALRLARAYGTRIDRVIGGEDLGGGLGTREVDHLVDAEWARTADDILWRRTRLGLHVGPDTVARLTAYLEGKWRHD